MTELIVPKWLAGETAIVTGGGSGIGRGIALLFGQAGAHVVVADIDGEQAESVSREIGDAEPLKLDIATADLRAEIDRVSARRGDIHVLVNNAGIFPMAKIDEVDDATWDRTFQVNLRGAFRIMQAVSRHMPDGGRIINIASIEAIRGTELGLAHYAASKAGLTGLTRAAAVEWGKRGIRVNAILPGVIASRGMESFPTGLAQFYAGQIPLGRVGAPQDIAGAALFLACPLSSFVDGQQLVVDGGMTIRGV